MAIILPANTLSSGFEVTNSCQFSAEDSLKMSKTLGTATNNKKFTVNVWIKIAKLGTDRAIFTARTGTSGAYFNCILNTDDQLNVYGNDKDSANEFDYKTNRVFRDTGAWYCFTFAMDTTLGTAGNILRIYVNGVEETSFATETNPTQDAIYVANYTGYTFVVGARTDNSEYWDGYQAEFCMIDGQQLTPTSFGEFDEDSPTIWKPIDVSGLTFGNNGFYLDFEDSSNLGNDVNGGTDLTESNIAAVHQVEDTPTNNFCILNQIQPYGSGVFTFRDAGTQFVGTQGNAWRVVSGSIAVTTGKYYYEVEINTSSANNSYSIGWLSTNNLPASVWTSYLGDINGPALGLGKGGTLDYSTHTANSQTDTGWTSYTNGADIVMCAIDLDNNYAYWGKNGTWMKSGDPESGATGTGGFAFENTAGYDWYPAFGSTEGASGSTIHMAANFGHGNFGNVSGVSSAVASAGSNASGFGVFEYNVPAGYGAICTKQMNE